ncbi:MULTISPECIES: hypothetical protein [Bacteroides]|uniref:hypothetical protein n=1 Tax=Bacteroides TaxID=816 RepID=UPI001C376010|nr:MULTISPECIES: hypothetical protein [Bacteroides]MBV3638910.1 hypothetical protein [Bacteroides cellulosilyticus]MBV3665099.1 hypothetical protein [Bacteroides cellulosilyticus]MBV3687029.1 hypothetical protein [Bacteroides cellulosilyticus]MBV3695821.1 hypothetical protein [Bacteroides cellulosilyticus]MBV3709390.1 hypothetical protein [Bacteroides cellulosilyticus]
MLDYPGSCVSVGPSCHFRAISVIRPYLLRINSVSAPYQTSSIGHGVGTELIRSRYGSGIVLKHRI